VIGLILLLLARWAGPSAAADIIGNNAGGGYSSPQNGRDISELALRAGAPELPASAPFVMTAFLVKPVPVAHSGARFRRSPVPRRVLLGGRDAGDRADGPGAWPARW
jgi:hypothetical protein